MAIRLHSTPIWAPKFVALNYNFWYAASFRIQSDSVLIYVVLWGERLLRLAPRRYLKLSVQSGHGRLLSSLFMRSHEPAFRNRCSQHGLRSDCILRQVTLLSPRHLLNSNRVLRVRVAHVVPVDECALFSPWRQRSGIIRSFPSVFAQILGGHFHVDAHILSSTFLFILRMLKEIDI